MNVTIQVDGGSLGASQFTCNDGGRVYLNLAEQLDKLGRLIEQCAQSAERTYGCKEAV